LKIIKKKGSDAFLQFRFLFNGQVTVLRFSLFSTFYFGCGKSSNGDAGAVAVGEWSGDICARVRAVHLFRIDSCAKLFGGVKNAGMKMMRKCISKHLRLFGSFLTGYSTGIFPALAQALKVL
jgi:hypothetical protein